MGCVISTVLKLVLQIINSVLAVAFLILALLGILLKTSQAFVKSLVTKIFSVKETDAEAQGITEFIIDNATAVSVVLIVGGLILAAICIIGCVSSCCGCGILLKVYALILIILIVVQIIAVSVVFSDPQKFTGVLLDELKQLTAFYGGTAEESDVATSIWNLFMTFGQEPCCAMDGYQDFTSITTSTYPIQCCKSQTQKCDINAAKSAAIPGCRAAIQDYTEKNMKIIMYIFVGAILCQAALLVLVIVTICLE